MSAVAVSSADDSEEVPLAVVASENVVSAVEMASRRLHLSEESDVGEWNPAPP